MFKMKDIRVSINLSYVEGANKNLRPILRSHKIRSTFYIESTLCKLLIKLKDRVTTKDKSNIVYEIYCSNCEAVYFAESLTSPSDEQKRSVTNCDCEK